MQRRSVETTGGVVARNARHVLAERIAQSSGRWRAGAFAAFASIGIHVLLVESVLLSEGGRHRQPQHKEGLGANAISSETEALATMILIEVPDAGSSNPEPLEPVASHGKVLQNLRLTIVSPEPTLDLSLEAQSEADKSKEATPEDAAGDRQARAELFGRYLAQIQARVERAWLRPRASIGAEMFECRVRIQQSSSHEVLEVTLELCNGDVSWQRSLVNAIERASPLPTPPDPKVFAESLQLAFQSVAFALDSGEDGFEPAVVSP